MKRLAVITFVLLIAAVAVYAVTNRKSSNSTTNGAANVPVDSGVSTNTTTNDNVNSTTQRDQMLAVARLFAERYGTTTSENPTANLDAVSSFASDALQATFVRLKASLTATSSSEVATVTSQAMAFSVVSFNESQGRGEVIVTLRRREEVGTSTPRTYTQDLTLAFLKEHGSWKVSIAVWGAVQ